ncbi:hypothetical protein Prudu_018198 [Prunus dulcis]
MNIM